MILNLVVHGLRLYHGLCCVLVDRLRERAITHLRLYLQRSSNGVVHSGGVHSGGVHGGGVSLLTGSLLLASRHAFQNVCV